MPEATEIVLVRHGQTVWNKEARFRGQADIPLDETGLWQAEQTGAYIAARWSLAAIYASPLGRAMQTAAAIASPQGLEVVATGDLLDIDCGDCKGLSVPEVKERFPGFHRAWGEAPEKICFPAGESLADVRKRATVALYAAVERHPAQTVALVAHTLVNRVLLCAALQLGNDYYWRFDQDTCAVNCLQWDGARFILTLLNDTNHLWRAARS